MNLFINVKTYALATGSRLYELVEKIKSVETDVNIVLAVQATDIAKAAEKGMPIWAQHCDPIEEGAHTGWMLPIALKEAGAVGTLLNHSEHKFENFEKLAKAHEKAKAVGLQTLIFASDEVEFEKILTLNPDYVSYEPPEFIGKTDTSVATEKPEVIETVAQLAMEKEIPLIVGAGIHSQEDVRKSIELGAQGVAIATNIVKAADSIDALKTILEGYK
jgi:triosephosphate isomerase